VHQARTEARAEAEAAAEQRAAAALALERAELDKQARSLLCICGSWPSTDLACCRRDESVTDWKYSAAHVMHLTAGGMR
jgi:hypothetical protein